MKSQDLFLLFKLLSLEQRAKEKSFLYKDAQTRQHSLFSEMSWKGWDDQVEEEACIRPDSYSVRALSASLGVSKTEISAAQKRCQAVGLLHLDPTTRQPRVNAKALLGFVEYGLRYVFPVRPAEITRGIPTAFAAPVLDGLLMSAGDIIPVWPDAYGNRKGQAIQPLFRTVPGAVKKDSILYEYLALLDAVRIGNPREANLANELLKKKILQSP